MKAVNLRTGELVSAIVMEAPFLFGSQWHEASWLSPLVIVIGEERRTVISELVLTTDYTTDPHAIRRALWSKVEVRNTEGR